jgi:hypothetical protein
MRPLPSAVEPLGTPGFVLERQPVQDPVPTQQSRLIGSSSPAWRRSSHGGSVIENHSDRTVFDTDRVYVLAEAFDRAWATIQSEGLAFTSKKYVEALRELLALQVIEKAAMGERDPQSLCDCALLYLARTDVNSTGL